jgi:sterol 24-C-methyltransferase
MSKLEREDHARDAAFSKAMHGNSAKAAGGIAAMLKKNSTAERAASDEYFKHWNKNAKDETAESRAVGLSSLHPWPSHSHANRLMCRLGPQNTQH